MAEYGTLMHRLAFETETEEDIKATMEELLSLQKRDLFIFIKSMAKILVSQQKEIIDLKGKLDNMSGTSSG